MYTCMCLCVCFFLGRGGGGALASYVDLYISSYKKNIRMS